MCGPIVFNRLRKLGLHIRMDSFKNMLVAGDDRVCTPYFRENGDGVGEGGGGASI